MLALMPHCPTPGITYTGTHLSDVGRHQRLCAVTATGELAGAFASWCPARPLPRSPVRLMSESAMWPQRTPARQMKNDRTNATTASVLKRSDPGRL
jgi:hypothetical protein